MRNSRRKAGWNELSQPPSCRIITGTPVGAVAVVSSGSALLTVAMGFSGESQARRHIENLMGTACLCWRENEGARQIRQYFAGTRRAFDLRCVLDALTPFHRKVLRACAEIPFGRLATYADLARAAGSPRAFRAAGQALKRNPCAIVIPCHRVVASDGIGGFSAAGGVKTKWALLEFEGVERSAVQERLG